MLYHGEFADDLPTLLREGGARLLVLLQGGLTAEEKAFGPLWVATRETFLDGKDKVALWPVEDYVSLRAAGVMPLPDIAWLPGRGPFRFSDGAPVLPPRSALTRPQSDREAAWVGMRYYFAWEGRHDGGLGKDAQLAYFEEKVEEWKKAVGAQWTRLGVPHPASFAQIASLMADGV